MQACSLCKKGEKKTALLLTTRTTRGQPDIRSSALTHFEGVVVTEVTRPWRVQQKWHDSWVSVHTVKVRGSTTQNRRTNGPAQTHRLLCCDPDPLQATCAGAPTKRKKDCCWQRYERMHTPATTCDGRTAHTLPADMHLCDCLQSETRKCVCGDQCQAEGSVV